MQVKCAFKFFLLSLMALQNLDLGQGSRILAAFIFPGKSHFMMSDAIIRELVKRGHEVTYITPFSLAKENLGPNYTEILLPQYNVWPEIIEVTNTKTILDMTDVSTFTFMRLVLQMGVSYTNVAFEQPEIQALIHAHEKIGKYDLLLAEQFYNEGVLILGHLYQIPIISLATFSHANYLSGVMGIVTPWSYVANAMLPYTDRMSLVERMKNVAISGIEELIRKFFYYPKQNAILRKHLSNILDEVPTVQQLERNISAIMFNTYMPLTPPRPLSLNTIQVGGLHIKPPKKLPDQLQKFLDEATQGVIYFSLGSQVRSADLPPEKLQIFLNVFAGLKQRILWKFEDENVSNLPRNVKVQKWMPQADILAHPNVKVFIAHGGLFGLQEAVHYGVPILGMPVYFDQHSNINMAQAAGYAVGLDYRTITEDQLRFSLTNLLENPKFRANMKQASRLFRDRPLSAMDTAMYWIDYVIEHRGAPHMISSGLDLTWYQFYLLDVVGIALAVTLLPILLLCYICRRFKAKATLKKTKPKKKTSKLKHN